VITFKIIDALVFHGELSRKELLQLVQCSQPSISRCIKDMVLKGLVEINNRGQIKLTKAGVLY
jgi:Mn-dependent DtxR family transcriptional regulator